MDASSLRNFKDFLQLYNKMTENCFARCVDNVNSRHLEDNEIQCVDNCALKFINFNNKLMTNFVRAQTELVSKRVKDAEEQQQIESNKAISIEPEMIAPEITQQEIVVSSS